MLKLLVNGVLKVLSILVGRICAGIALCVKVPNGPQKKNPAALPTAALAASAYCWGLSPESCCMFAIFITALAGISACPGATTRLSRSMPINNCGTPPDRLPGHATLLAVICASVRFGETHSPPGNSEASIAATASVGTPKNPRGNENG